MRFAALRYRLGSRYFSPIRFQALSCRGAEIIGPPGGHGLFARAGVGAGFETAEAEILSTWALGASAFIDVGANLGIHALPLLASNPALCGYLFEANPRTAAYLQLGVLRNRVDARAELVCAAVAAAAGLSAFASFSRVGTTGDGLRDTGRCGTAVGRVVVPVITLDQWLEVRAPARVDFVKLDIEGAELLALRGARGLLARYRPRILTEYFRTNVHAYGLRLDDIYAFAEESRYVVLDLSGTPLGYGAASARFGLEEADPQVLSNLVLEPHGG